MEVIFNRFSARAITSAVLLSVFYLAWVWFFVGFRPDHLFLLALCLSAWFFHHRTRKFIRAFFIFVIYWIVYDAMRILPNYQVNPVHIEQPYLFEKRLFGISSHENILTPNEYFDLHQSIVADLLAGLFYINWVPVPLAFAFYLMVNDKDLFLRFAYAFVLTNFIGFTIYYLYPAAPPWYVHKYGFELLPGIAADTGSLARVDAFLGVNIFGSIYSKNANIFAAIPSLHAAYPVLVLYYGFKKRLRSMYWFFILFLGGIWFAAVYTFQHYIIDILAGAGCAILGVFVFEYLYAQPRINRFFFTLAQSI